MDSHSSTQRSVPVVRVGRDSPPGEVDLLAVEEPLGVLLSWPGREAPLEFVVAMRTPGDDAALAVGYLLGERVIGDATELTGLTAMPGPEGEASHILVELSAEPVGIDAARRSAYANSSCGLCGAASVEAIVTSDLPELDRRAGVWSADLVHRLPGLMREHQSVFDRTGGLHAAALVGADGRLRTLAEDIGRHNAVDKVIGRIGLTGERPAGDDILAVSGRAGFEIVQKARAAGIAGMAAVGAPSSLAVALAERSGMTLIGFVRGGRFNVYCGSERVEVRREAANLRR